MRWTWHVHEEGRILVGTAEGRRPRRRWVDSTRIEMDLAEIGWDDMDWVDLA
jgi:hypothetical protein